MKLQIFHYTILLFNCFQIGLSAQEISIECPQSGTVIFDSHTTDDPDFWNQSYWYDPVIQQNRLAEEEISLTCVVKDYNGSGPLHFRYILTLHLDADTTKKTIIDSDNLPAANTVWFNNLPGNLFSGQSRHFGSTTIPVEEQLGFDLEVLPTDTARVIWRNTLGNKQLPAIPYGTHHIEWIVSDSNGNNSTCAYYFKVRDAEPPVLDCLPQSNPFVYHSDPFFVYSGDLIDSVTDNYASSSGLELGIRLSGIGTGFPYNYDGSTQNVIKLGCWQLGTHLFEIWAKDAEGNTTSCNHILILQDMIGTCEPPGIIWGNVTNPITGKGVSGVFIDVDYVINNDTFQLAPFDTTYGNGNYFSNFFQMQNTEQIIITPFHNQNPLNGLSAWDLVLISRHILGLAPLNSPYKLISADANRSGTITTFDVVELRKLLLGTYTTLPDNTSWRFVQKTQYFQHQNNPFAETIQENVVINTSNLWLELTNFFGCKIGDVDGTVNEFFQGEPEDRNLPIRAIKVKDQWLKAGETVDIHFEMPQDLDATQLTMSGTGIRLENLDPGKYGNDHFGIFANESNAFQQPLFTAVLEESGTGFNVQFTALKNGYLHEMLALSDEITPTKAFGRDGAQYNLTLAFEGKDDVEDNTILFPNTPNPWHDFTQIMFRLPEATTVTHLVTDQHGKPVFSKTAAYNGGYQQIIFNRDDFPEAGIYYYQLITDKTADTQKLILLH